MSIPSNNDKGISNETWRIMTTSTSHKWFHITSRRNHETSKKQDPASNIKQGSVQHNESHSEKKYMNPLHIPHILGPYEEKDVKLLKLAIPSILRCWISWNDCSHIECWHLQSTLKSCRKTKWSNGKSEYTIRFVAPSSAETIVQNLNSENLKIRSSRNHLDSLKIPQRFYFRDGLKIRCSDVKSDYTIMIPSENHEKQV